MKHLQQIIRDITPIHIVGNDDAWVPSLVMDSRNVTEGALFFAVKGNQADGHQFIGQALQKGAKVIVCEVLPESLPDSICFLVVPDVAAIIGRMAASFYDQPSHKLAVVAVTGTNGKTTVATILYKLFTALGYRSGLLSTVQNHIGDNIVPATHTTPDPISLQQLLARMVDEQCSHVFMEASSHAIHQHRIAGIRLAGAIFTNISHDHLDYHHTFEEYIKVKKTLFDHLDKEAFALSNSDDRRGMIMLQNTAADKKTYSLKTPSDFKGKVLENNLDGLQMSIEKIDVHFRLSGLFNAYNILAVYGAAVLLGIDKMNALSVLSGITGASGRFETFRSLKDQVLGIIDYAHTPDALLNVLATIKQFNTQHQIITVAGCGGDRDKTKRPVMAKVACEYSDKVILTSDNPRTEDPEQILNDMESELSIADKRKVIRISDRKEAIKTACILAQKEDIILLAGKGHETYQEVNGIRHHFDDHEILKEMFVLLDK